MTAPRLTGVKAAGRKITMRTAYDYTMAGLLDAAGIEGIPAGDSSGKIVQGQPNALSAPPGQTIYHAAAVSSAGWCAPVVVDVTFLSYRLGIHKTLFVRSASATRVPASSIAAAVRVALTLARKSSTRIMFLPLS